MLDGGSVIFGGEKDKQDLYIAPTLLDNVDKNSALMKEEIFGPLLPILPFNELDDVITFINSMAQNQRLYLYQQHMHQKTMIFLGLEDLN